MELLALLWKADRPLSTEELMDTMYPTGARPGREIIAVVVSQLRKKLKAAFGGNDPIETFRGVGFKLHRETLHAGGR
jgi:DNA-binding response OmpR family regulator